MNNDENSYKGGACMLDDLPHQGLLTIAMDQTYWQDGYACGTCVKIAKTSVDTFDPNRVFKLEEPIDTGGEDMPGDFVVAMVSDLCPSVGQCWSGLDMHGGTWQAVTSSTTGTKIPIQWKFTSCKDVFTQTGQGGDALEVHWRPGSGENYCNVQIRGSYEAVVKVEAQPREFGYDTDGTIALVLTEALTILFDAFLPAILQRVPTIGSWPRIATVATTPSSRARATVSSVSVSPTGKETRSRCPRAPTLASTRTSRSSVSTFESSLAHGPHWNQLPGPFYAHMT